MLHVKIRKISINTDTDLAIMNNDFSLSDNHPNIKIGDERIGFVEEDKLTPVVGESYIVMYDLEPRLSTRYFSTSKIVKIINNKTFMTRNSVYVVDLIDRKINYWYKVPYEKVDFSELTSNCGPHFTFEKKNESVDLSNYNVLVEETEKLADHLKNNKHSRQAIYIFSTNEIKNCLTSIQFLITYDTTVSLIANFRSQHHTLGMPHDVALLKHLMTVFLNRYGDLKKKEIHVNVADYHYS